jgi:UrcA family protein
MRNVALALILLAAPLAAAPAFAEDSQSVSTAGADLNDPAVVGRLHQAVVRTADNICRRSGASGMELRSCVRDAVDRAIASNPSPQLRAFHQSVAADQRYQLAAN